MKYLFRFVGDPAGYLVDMDEGSAIEGWQESTRGISFRKCWVNVGQAYLMEPYDDFQKKLLDVPDAA